jgi:hypothetical protein
MRSTHQNLYQEAKKNLLEDQAICTEKDLFTKFLILGSQKGKYQLASRAK